MHGTQYMQDFSQDSWFPGRDFYPFILRKHADCHQLDRDDRHHSFASVLRRP